MIDAKELIEKAGLTERQVRFIIGYFYEGFYQRDIAEQEGCSRPTVSVELTAAVKKLEGAGFPAPRRLPRPEVHYFENAKLNTLTKRAGEYWQWLDDHRH